jgi:hypothetical protein
MSGEQILGSMTAFDRRTSGVPPSVGQLYTTQQADSPLVAAVKRAEALVRARDELRRKDAPQAPRSVMVATVSVDVPQKVLLDAVEAELEDEVRCLVREIEALQLYPAEPERPL